VLASCPPCALVCMSLTCNTVADGLTLAKLAIEIGVFVVDRCDVSFECRAVPEASARTRYLFHRDSV